MLIAVRDARASNALDRDTRPVDLLLKAWAKWARDQEHMGWPESIFGAIVRYGAQGAAHHGAVPVSMPEEIARVDAAVARLCEIDRRAITRYYLWWHEAPSVCARRLKMRERELTAVLRRARWRIGYALGI